MNTDTSTPSKSIVPFGKQGVQLTNLEDAYRFAVAVSKSGFAPKGVDTPEAILIAVQFGAELGLTPMSALQSLAIVNGRPSIYGDAALALVRASGELESYQQSTSGEGETMKATVRVKRKNEAEIVSEFSVSDAKKASLWGKQGPWSQYPGRMLMWRARGFALRDAFGDVLRGLRTVEEAQDIEPEQALKAAKPVFAKREATVDKKPTETPSLTAASGGESSEVPVAQSGAKEPESTAQSSTSHTDADKLGIMIGEAGLTFAQMVPVLHGSRLCSRNAQSVSDISDKNVAAIIEDFVDIVKAVNAEAAQ